MDELLKASNVLEVVFEQFAVESDIEATKEVYMHTGNHSSCRWRRTYNNRLRFN